jgi:hypothetical protein
MASAKLEEAVEPRKKGNVKYASFCAILASMAAVILGYGNHIRLSFLSKKSAIFGSQELAGSAPVLIFTLQILG